MEKINEETIADILKAEYPDTTLTYWRKVINDFEDIIIEAVVNNKKVVLPKFGIFQKKLRKERQGRNPATGEPLTIPASYAVKFKPSSHFKREVKN